MTKEPNPYLLIFRDTDWHTNLPVEEVQRVMSDYTVWMKKMTANGTFLGGKPLYDGGRVVIGTRDGVTDGPFVESKEVIGGYMLIRANSLDEAVEIAKSFPPITMGQSAEIRETASECPLMELMRQNNPEVAAAVDAAGVAAGV
ncbi:hypothetical protein DB346_18615 [Verrucomicrobia bacterium LW23]|nr:hypothetical protein DB346_18615 [Verrucomicrobia bacterium LW23]